MKITINHCEMPTTGWVLWKGDAAHIEQLFKQVLQIEPSENIKNANVINTDGTLKLAAIFEWGGLLSNKTLLENILLPQEYVGKPTADIKNRVYKLFSSMSYEVFLDKRPFYVPRNVQKIAAIARAFFQEPDVLLVQNLAFGLQPRDMDQLSEFIKQYRNVNIHFSDTGIFSENEFDLVIDYEKWEMAG